MIMEAVALRIRKEDADEAKRQEREQWKRETKKKLSDQYG